MAGYGLLAARVFTRSYAVKTAAGTSSMMGLGKGKKKGMTGKLGAITEKQLLPVETDIARLVNYACGTNIYITGEDEKLKPDSEYPDWLWTLNIGPVPKIADLDPTTKEYWIRVRAMGRKRDNKLRSLKRF